MSPRPIPKSEELLSSIITYVNGGAYNELATRRFIREAERLVDSPNSDASAQSALGIILTVVYDYDRALSLFRSAILRDQSDATLNLHYSITLRLAGYPHRALQQAMESWEKRPGSPYTAAELVSASIECGKFSEAKKWNEKWHQMKPERPNERSQLIDDLIGVLDDSGGDEEALSDMIHIATALMHENELNSSLDLRVTHDEFSQWIVYEAPVAASPRDVARLNHILCDRLAETDIVERLNNCAIFSFYVDTKRWQSSQKIS